VALLLMMLGVVGGLGAMTHGVRRVALPDQRGPWQYLLGAAWLSFAGIILRAFVPGAGASPPTAMALIPDAFVLPGYVLMGYGFAAMLQRRRAVDDDSARVDAVLAGLTTAFLCWTYLVAPSIDQEGMSPLRIANSFFPVIDVVLLILVAQLALSGARAPSLWLLMLSAAAMFTGDFVFMVRDGNLADVSAQAVNVLFVATFVLLGAAMVHPSMRTLTQPQRIVVKDLSKVRTTLIALLVVIPVVLTTFEPVEGTLDGTVRAVLCVLLILAIVYRVVRSNNSRARAEDATRRRVTHDALTDLPNRELLTDTITAWGEQDIGLLFLDLDRFKLVNDHWGHQVGDELLCAVADRLSRQVRPEDLVCRIGGDEFVVALRSSAFEGARPLAARLLTELARPFELSVGNVAITASIGVAMSRDGAHALDLIRDADTAMYKAKDSGRNAYALFDESLHEQVRIRMDLEQALRGALERGELYATYQPIIDLETGELDGYETLMRWQHPQLGAVSPLQFIPIAEETGLIVDAGAWLLRESAHQLAAWRAGRGPDARPLHVSVNVSVRQLRDLALVDLVRDVLIETGLPPGALWLEITESGVMEDLETALAALNALHDLGIILAIDDFGTGYSSLSYLNRLPVGILKIDRSFVSEVGLTPEAGSIAGAGSVPLEGERGANESIVRAVLAMTKAMNLRVVAEGVETELQRDWLRAQGCDLGQGWLFGKPMVATAVSQHDAVSSQG
jgi:diguanylate cyclase (GGDEF)-like protein